MFTGLIRLQFVVDAIHHRFPGRVGDQNVTAATAAFDLVTSMRTAAQGEEPHA